MAKTAKTAAPQTRWAWVEIDLAALRRNTHTFKSLLARGVKLMAVVKADAYGHGAIPCAKTMLSSGADQLAVSTVDEGVELREGGIDAPILILSEPPIDSVDVLIAYDLMPSVFTSDFALVYGESAAAAGKVGRYHLAIDTGMTRTGIRWDEVCDLRAFLDFHRGLECAGTFTHFATADEVSDWDFTLQLKRFNSAIDALRAEGFDPGIVHCDNTPGTILHPECHYDMVRVGIGLYGLHPAHTTIPRIELAPVMSVRAKVTRVVWPEVGDGVSYGMHYRVPRRNIQIATIPIGYADGLSRTLSGNMPVLVKGLRCRQVGSICMDQCMFAADVNSVRAYRPISSIEVGDVVTIMGSDGDDAITADEIAELRGTINYEVVCDFGLRLEKIYV
ncbi:MAG: alanine racemase [Atopobiaceae bacterium]|nr:alanine racemase [Atopobiaceae bacterium]